MNESASHNGSLGLPSGLGCGQASGAFAPPPILQEALVPFLLLYSVVIVLGVAGNLLVLVTLFSLWHTFGVTEVFVLSLTCSDLLIVVLNVPFQLFHYLSPTYNLGEAMCKWSNYMQGVTIVASILTLSAIAVDRYMLTCHALTTRGFHRPRNAVVIVVLLWSLTFGVCTPQLWLQRLHVFLYCPPGNNITLVFVCIEAPANSGIDIQWYTVGTYIAYFLCPLLLMGCAYGAIVQRLWCRMPVGDVRQNTTNSSSLQKRRLAKMLISIMAAFFFCWLPFHTVNLIKVLIDGSTSRELDMGLKLLGYCNSVVNPVIYAVLHRKYRAQMCLIGQQCHSFGKALTPPGRHAASSGAAPRNRPGTSKHGTEHIPLNKPQSRTNQASYGGSPSKDCLQTLDTDCPDQSRI